MNNDAVPARAHTTTYLSSPATRPEGVHANDRDTSRFTQPNMAIDHVRSIARATAKESGYDAAATALLALYREYRVMPLRRKETPPERLATWEAVRIETRELVPMAMASPRGRPGRCRLL